jgi:hypothetical protein
MEVKRFRDDWYIATFKKAGHIYQGYGTTFANAIEDCLRDIQVTKELYENKSRTK